MTGTGTRRAVFLGVGEGLSFGPGNQGPNKRKQVQNIAEEGEGSIFLPCNVSTQVAGSLLVYHSRPFLSLSHSIPLNRPREGWPFMNTGSEVRQTCHFLVVTLDGCSASESWFPHW